VITPTDVERDRINWSNASGNTEQMSKMEQQVSVQQQQEFATAANTAIAANLTTPSCASSAMPQSTAEPANTEQPTKDAIAAKAAIAAKPITSAKPTIVVKPMIGAKATIAATASSNPTAEECSRELSTFPVPRSETSKRVIEKHKSFESFFQGYRCKGCISNCSPHDMNSQTSRARAIKSYDGVPAPGNDGHPIITFKKCDEVKVMEKVNLRWWRGCCLDSPDFIGFFPASYVIELRHGLMHQQSEESTHVSIDLTTFPWFVPKMDRTKAEHLLLGAKDGTFIVRVNNGNHALSLAFGGSTKHIRIKYKECKGYHIASIKFFPCINDLVEFYRENSLVASIPGLTTKLLQSTQHPKSKK
jgi:hypothetical protein